MPLYYLDVDDGTRWDIDAVGFDAANERTAKLQAIRYLPSLAGERADADCAEAIYRGRLRDYTRVIMTVTLILRIG